MIMISSAFNMGCKLLVIYQVQRLIRNIFIMDKLGQITIDNSLSVVINCQVDQNLLAKNFINIINALKELQQAQLKTQSQLSDYASLKAMIDQLNQKLQSQSKLSNQNKTNQFNNNNERSQNEKIQSSNNETNYSADLLSNLQSLVKRVEKNEQNTLGNTKDINLINKELSILRSDVDDLKNQKNDFTSNNNTKEAPGYNIANVAQNLSKELQSYSQKMSDMQEKIKKMESEIEKLNEKLKGLENNKGNKDQKVAENIKNNGQNELQELRNDLREKLDVINKKINNIQSGQNQLQGEVAQIRDLLNEKNNENTTKVQNTNNNNQSSQHIDLYRKELSDLKKKIDEVDKRQIKDVKMLQDQLKKLKSQFDSHHDEENTKSRRKTVNNEDLSDKIYELEKKVAYLEKLFAGSKNSLTDQKNPEKLPAINRPKKKDPNLTAFGGQRQKVGVGRKDLAQLRTDLEIWIKGLFDQSKQKESFKQLQLKIQEMRRALQKKADAEGTKKGFNFLQNKITQLYLFLTEPETEDAMIVRKGFNCLSCSKKVEKLRGKLGPRLNWNNMTSTNYSPPRVGYSKPMGENTGEKEDYQ